MSIALLTLIGNLGRDPEMSYTPDGMAVTKFSLAVSKGKGEKETTTWFNCTAFRQSAETLSTYLKKGSQVCIVGELVQRSYTTKDGRPGTSLDVTVDKFTFIGGKVGDESGAKSGFAGNANSPLGDIDEPF